MDYRHYQALRGPARTLGMMQAHEFSKRFWYGTSQKTEGICSCGCHKGITLMNNGEVHEVMGVRAEGLCIISFWLAKAQIIMIERGGKEAISWTSENPLEDLLVRFSLGSGTPRAGESSQRAADRDATK